MYRLAICDDNPADIAYLSAILKQWAQDNSIPIRLESFPSAEAFLFQYQEEKGYDILLLDIEMKQMSGMELAWQIRREDRSLQIIFITGYMEYISQGYDVEALHYLLKPVTEEKLKSVLSRAIQRCAYKEQELYLPAKRPALGEGEIAMVRIPVYEIRYLEVRKNYVTIHAREDFVTKKPLNELEAQLGESFFRTGRSFIINLKCVSKITKSQVFLKDGTAVPLSRKLYEGLNRAMIAYF